MNNDEISQYIERAWDDLRQWAKDNRVSLERLFQRGLVDVEAKLCCDIILWIAGFNGR
jgi:hypothetical protein